MSRSASLLILSPQGKLLLLQRGGEATSFQGDWEFPTGKVNGDESPDQAVLREAREEAGLLGDLPAGEPLCRAVIDSGDVQYSFFVWIPASGERPVTLRSEHVAHKWVSFTEARKMRMLAPHRDFMDRYWHQEQVKSYGEERPHYIAFKKFLEAILNRLKARWAPLAIVQAREKGLSSFSEKCMRKADEYDDPAHQLTDLCGARIIATTTHEVNTLIPQIKKLFDVDELEDTGRRHDIAEFGYLSVHFLVHIKKGVTEILGVPVPPEIGGRKAEIQVRTMLQHAHSEVTHDRLYKTGFNPPQHRRREAARVAAVLESADDQFARFVSQLDAYAGNYASHLPPEKRRREIEDLKLVLKLEEEMEKKAPDLKPVLELEKEMEKKADLALRIARLARAAWDWPAVTDRAEPYLEGSSPVFECLRMEVGHALCLRYQDRPSDIAYRRGLKYLQAVARPYEPAAASVECDERDRRATALAWLGWAHSRQTGLRPQARSCLELAVELAPENPYHLAAFVELDVISGGAYEHLALMAPSLRQAAGRCEEHILAGIEVTDAWLTLAKLRFLLNDPFSALEALCLGARSTETHHPLLESVRSFKQLKDALGVPRPDVNWLCAAAQLLCKAKERSGHPSASESDWEPLTECSLLDPSQPVTIFAGATAEAETARITEYELLVRDGLAGYRGIVISGGTTAGVCGLVARVASQLNSSNKADIKLFGYVPEHVPARLALDPAFTLIKTLRAHDFSLLEPIQMWTDLLVSGVDPKKVRLFCLAGHELSAAELALAWALGARAAVVHDGSVAAKRFASLLDWACGQTDSGMMLPDDPATLISFFAFEEAIVPEEWEKTGEAIHQAYLQSQQKGTKQPNMLPWHLLRDDFKHSNRHQAACSVKILSRFGFAVEQSPLPLDQIPLAKFSPEQIEKLAEWEHGRWNMERLKSGWRYGEKKDEERKLSPCLVSWEKLPDEIKNYDRDAVRCWPSILAQAGWAVRKS